jgi:hypothetical protein
MSELSMSQSSYEPDNPQTQVRILVPRVNLLIVPKTVSLIYPRISQRTVKHLNITWSAQCLGNTNSLILISVIKPSKTLVSEYRIRTP